MKAAHGTAALLPAEQLSAHWARMHENAAFAFSAGEAHYLRTLAMALDDDLVALLLLKKLRMATEREAAELPHDVVAMNSLVRFTFGGDECAGRLTHPSCCGPGSLSIASRTGAGLVGMRRGQTVLWPDSREALRPLRVDAVECLPSQKPKRLHERIR
jgi:regulator of nucleoside diphosphate kinase